MTVKEIYEKLASHMKKGLTFHQRMASYYEFLNLCGYSKCHDYHYYAESYSYRKLINYFINHHYEIIKEDDGMIEQFIPSDWYEVKKADVDASTKQNAVKTGLQLWANWERDTKKLYEQMYKQLMAMDEVASALFIKQLICDVDKQLEEVQHYKICKKNTGYNIEGIYSEQKADCDKYKKEMNKLWY